MISFTVHMDHDAIRWTLSISNVTEKLGRWRKRFSDFQFDVVHQAGSKHQAAYALSGLPPMAKDEKVLNEDVPVQLINEDTVSDDKSCVWTITDDNYGWPTKPVSADETDKSKLG